MKVAYVYAVLGATTFTWSWRSADEKQHSSTTFPFYFDCLQDARNHGYTAEFTNVPKTPVLVRQNIGTRKRGA